MSGFQGFLPECFTFFSELEKNNSKEYWVANKATWDNCVRTPMKALLAELDAEFPSLRMFRPNRDLRFAKDNSPYKLWAGATSDTRAVGGTGYYLRVDASGLTVGCGAMLLAREQLQRFRASLDHDAGGRRFEDLTTELSAKALPVTSGAEPPLKRTPPGFPGDHPRANYLRWKGAVVITEHKKEDWLHTPHVLDRVRGTWHGAQPLNEWIAANVGDR